MWLSKAKVHWEIRGTKEAEYVAEDQAKRFAESIY
jgi:hypothetical protein